MEVVEATDQAGGRVDAVAQSLARTVQAVALAADKNETRLDVLFRHVRGGVSELDAAADRMGEQVDTFKGNG